MNVLIYVTPSPPDVMRIEPRGIPVGALTIGTYAKHAGHHVKIVDGNFYKSISEVTGDGFVPDVLGVSMLTMYGVLVMDSVRDFIADVRKFQTPPWCSAARAPPFFPRCSFVRNWPTTW